VLFPTREETVVTLARNRSALSRNFRVPTPGWEAIRHAWDKRETYRLGERLSIPSPRTWFPRSEAELDRIEMSGPLVIKPAIKEHHLRDHAKAWRAV
jgi:predicted ATP-grasp superfamily ATP-dependent carboligase